MLKIFENDDFLVIKKNIHIDFHGENGLLEQLRAEYRQLFGIHRLDKETSGLMVFAKNKQVQSDISRLFEDRLVTKYYLALARQKPKKKMGSIIGDLEKGRGGSYYLKSTKLNPSQTIFTHKNLPESKLRLFILKPKTGKTHQLRVVMKSLGAPIIGDERYSKIESDRMYLHAFKLSFRYKQESYNFLSYPLDGDLFNTKGMQDLSLIHI